MNRVSIKSYGNYSSDNYGAHSLKVEIGTLTLYFSYETIIAFGNGSGNGLKITKNYWGTTTGKHLNAISTNKSIRLDQDTFQRELDEVLKSHNLTV